MKTNKKIVAWLVATAIVALSLWSASAMWHWGWMWNGHWKWMYQWQWIYKGQGMHKGQGRWQGHNMQKHNLSEMISGIKKQDLNTIEIDLLKKQYEEEMMANELYASFYEKYKIETFKKISESEAKHMQAVKALLDRYDIPTPTNYVHIQDLYNSLKETWSKSEFQALEVWVKIEFVDIDDIVTAIKSTDNDDIKVVFTNIWGASYNHLRGFLKAIENNWYETKLDWKKYISEDDLDVRWPIKYKLAEKLESEGIKLPEQVSSENIKNKKWKWYIDWKYKWKKFDTFNKYKKAINAKYWKIIRFMSDEKLKNLINKIDILSEKIENSSNYSDTQKQKYRYVLWALKQIAEDNLDDIDLDIDELLK